MPTYSVAKEAGLVQCGCVLGSEHFVGTVGNIIGVPYVGSTVNLSSCDRIRFFSPCLNFPVPESLGSVYMG